MLDITKFDWTANDFCKKFKSSGSEERFIQIFDEELKSQESIVNEDFSLSGPSNKRQCLIEVASHQAREREAAEKAGLNKEFEDTGIDLETLTYHQGNFALPVKCLEPPPEEWLVRKCSKNIVDQLKQEMVDNTCTDVQPILCIVQLKRDETFNPLVKEGYKYNTIGGNHSRQALQELLSEKPELKSSKQFTHRTCSVYSAMDTILVRRLANKHNRAATHVHEITTMDWIQQCRKLLYELSNTSLDHDPPSKKPEKWRKACSTVLVIDIEKLDERLIYFLSALPNETFGHVRKIFDLHAQGELKTIARSKKGAKGQVPDLPGSSFKPFRGLDQDTLCQLMADISSKKLTFREAVSKCSDIKAIQKVRNCFMKVTGCKTWEQAEEKYPCYTSSEKLEPFKSLNCSGVETPAQLLHFCKRAMEFPCPVQDSGVVVDHENVFLIQNSNSSGLLWKTKLCDATPGALRNCFAQVGRSGFPGFSLSFLDFTGMELDMVQQEAKQALRVLRALNYNDGLQHFYVILMCDLSVISYLADSLHGSYDKLDYGACGLSEENEHGAGNKQHTTIGLLMTTIGSPSFQANKPNFFTHKNDAYVTDSATGKKVYDNQKPVSFYNEMMELLSAQDDWILSAPTGIGSAMIAGITGGRNVCTVEHSDVNFIQSKIRVVKEVSKPVQTTDETETIAEYDNGTS
ncbi:uncharacterized protein [Dysidea avara]|uniref:uncharacterized protein n=1 Tax=Dysidea avara TaxID=196820 RepID=UPI00331A48C5